MQLLAFCIIRLGMFVMQNSWFWRRGGLFKLVLGYVQGISVVLRIPEKYLDIIYTGKAAQVDIQSLFMVHIVCIVSVLE